MAKTFCAIFLLVFLPSGCLTTNPSPPDSKPPTSDASNKIATVEPEVKTPEVRKPEAESKSNLTEFDRRLTYDMALPKQEIIQVQKQLSELGYKPGKADGIFGKNTLVAITQFQKDNNLTVTGKFNVQTINMLEQRIKERSAPPSAKVKSASPSTQAQSAPANPMTSQGTFQAKQNVAQTVSTESQLSTAVENSRHFNAEPAELYNAIKAAIKLNVGEKLVGSSQNESINTVKLFPGKASLVAAGMDYLRGRLTKLEYSYTITSDKTGGSILNLEIDSWQELPMRGEVNSRWDGIDQERARKFDQVGSELAKSSRSKP